MVFSFFSLPYLTVLSLNLVAALIIFIGWCVRYYLDKHPEPVDEGDEREETNVSGNFENILNGLVQGLFGGPTTYVEQTTNVEQKP